MFLSQECIYATFIFKIDHYPLKGVRMDHSVNNSEFYYDRRIFTSPRLLLICWWHGALIRSRVSVVSQSFYTLKSLFSEGLSYYIFKHDSGTIRRYCRHSSKTWIPRSSTKCKNSDCGSPEHLKLLTCQMK